MDCRRLLVLSIALTALCGAAARSRQLKQTSADASTDTLVVNGSITGTCTSECEFGDVSAREHPLCRGARLTPSLLLLQARPLWSLETSVPCAVTSESGSQQANIRTRPCSCRSGSCRRRARLQWAQPHDPPCSWSRPALSPASRWACANPVPARHSDLCCLCTPSLPPCLQDSGPASAFWPLPAH